MAWVVNQDINLEFNLQCCFIIVFYDNKPKCTLSLIAALTLFSHTIYDRVILTGFLQTLWKAIAEWKLPYKIITTALHNVCVDYRWNNDLSHFFLFVCFTMIPQYRWQKKNKNKNEETVVVFY